MLNFLLLASGAFCWALALRFCVGVFAILALFCRLILPVKPQMYRALPNEFKKQAVDKQAVRLSNPGCRLSLKNKAAVWAVGRRQSWSPLQRAALRPTEVRYGLWKLSWLYCPLAEAHPLGDKQRSPSSVQGLGLREHGGSRLALRTCWLLSTK